MPGDSSTAQGPNAGGVGISESLGAERHRAEADAPGSSVHSGDDVSQFTPERHESASDHEVSVADAQDDDARVSSEDMDWSTTAFYDFGDQDFRTAVSSKISDPLACSLSTDRTIKPTFGVLPCI